MNETQKSLIIVGLVLFLLAIAHHVLFVQMIKSDLEDYLYQYELEEFSMSPHPDSMDPANIQDEDVLNMQRKLRRSSVLNYFFLFAGLAAMLASYFLREKRGDEVEDEWEDEEWEGDEW